MYTVKERFDKMCKAVDVAVDTKGLVREKKFEEARLQMETAKQAINFGKLIALVDKCTDNFTNSRAIIGKIVEE